MKLATIELIKDIKPIEGADKIELAFVLGFQAIVPKGTYSVGEKIVFIQPDTVLPEKPWAEFYKKKSSRVKSIRLKGVWSQGVIEKIENVGLFFRDSYDEGMEVSEIIGVQKYEAPAPQDLSAKGNLLYGIGKTDEERIENLNEIPYGQDVICTLKIDGSSSSYGCKLIDGNPELFITSRTLNLKLDCVNNYTLVDKKYNILDKLRDYCAKNQKSYCIRGEMYGPVQKFKHNPHVGPLDFAAFNLLNLDSMEYENFDKCVEVCQELGIPTVPVLERAILTPELVKKYTEDLNEIGGKPYEGVVLKFGSKSCKLINKHYDSLKG